MEVVVLKEEEFNNCKFLVNPGTRIKDLKSNIARGKDVSEEHLRLFYMDQELEDEKTLSDYNISNYSAIKLVPNDNCYRIRGQNGTYELYIKPQSTFCDLKNMIKDHDNVDISQISLYSGKREIVVCSRTIGEFYPNGSTFDLVIEKFREEIKVFVQSMTGKYITIEIKPSDTIQEFMLRIQNKEGIPPEQQHIKYKDSLIDYHDREAAVQDFSIKHESTLYLVHVH